MEHSVAELVMENRVCQVVLDPVRDHWQLQKLGNGGPLCRIHIQAVLDHLVHFLAVAAGGWAVRTSDDFHGEHGQRCRIKRRL